MVISNVPAACRLLMTAILSPIDTPERDLTSFSTWTIMAPHVPSTRLATLQISLFVDRPGLAEGLVPALLEHWRPWFPDDTWEARTRRLEQHMNRGVVVEDQARALGFERLYLFTLDQQALYRGLGWSPLERIAWRGVDCDLMV